MKPQKIPNMPIDLYHRHEAIGSTDLGRLLKRPSLFKAHRDGIISTESKCLDIGQGLHCLALEGQAAFNQRFIVSDADGRSKAHKDLVAANPDKTVLRPDDLELITKMRDGIFRNEVAKQLLEHKGETECSFFWEIDDIKCKCRPDKAILDYNGRAVLIDLKTSSDATPAGFTKAAASFGYHRQSWWYAAGVEAVTGTTIDLFIFLVIEKSEPFEAATYVVSDAALAIAERECRTAIETYKGCMEKNQWPGFPQGINQIELPRWYSNNQNDQGDDTTWN